MDFILTAQNLGKQYRHIYALNGFNMHVPKGSIYGFVGRNGAGKTTLIRLICGLQEPGEGSFSLYGIQNSDNNIIYARRRMGAVVESPAIYLDLSAAPTFPSLLPRTFPASKLLHKKAASKEAAFSCIRNESAELQITNIYKYNSSFYI